MSYQYIAYTRVSTTKQTNGTSLSEQRYAITEYARKHNLEIIRWFEEIQSASRGKRVVFQELLKHLKQQNKTGLIMHKVDRGARSLKDWSDIAELMDAGVTIKFAHDDLDMESRGGRLTADIQAVIAADYIRNLREEVKKGMQGRIKQGIYPFGAPVGYLNNGKGKVKVPDPIKAPLIVEMFHLYASGNYTLKSLTARMYVLGLHNKNNQPLTPGVTAKILKHCFYVGEFKCNGQVYHGQHQPLITRELFNATQTILRRHGSRKRLKHSFLYTRRLRCVSCKRMLIGEKHNRRTKSYVYYRCHLCKGVCFNERDIQSVLRQMNSPIILERPIRTTLTPYEKFESPRVSKISS